MRIEVLTVGDELVGGAVADSNSGWLCRRLAAAELPVSAVGVVGDDPAAITGLATAALGRADALIVTGGLGPTSDDVTAAALAPVAGGGAVTPIPNAVGSAPGLRLDTPAGVVYALPGPPVEMAAMAEAQVLPDLLRRAGARAAHVTRTLYVPLAHEQEVADRLAPVEQGVAAGGHPIRVAYLHGPGLVRVGLTARAGTAAAAAELLEPWLARAAAALGDTLSGVDEPPDVTLHRLLAAQGATVAVAESLTGGMLGAALTAMAGSSATFRGGVTAYATELKAALLGVDPGLLAARGAVDAEVAGRMAAGVAARLGSSYGVATTGVAGPDPQDGQPPGTVFVAVAGSGSITVEALRLRGDRDRIRALTVAHALDAARRRVAGLPRKAEDVK